MRPSARVWCVRMAAAGACTLAAAPLLAQPAQTPALQSATIEELMGITVTSAGRKTQRAEDVAAAIYVITRAQIQQSGLRTLPEILRLAPGVQVARAGSNKWAVSVRGFNDVYSNKLLILVDGRSAYNRSFSGVFWEAQDALIDEIERIEVIRGPGGALWGANAVTGILNIITRHAAESAGGAAEVSFGDFDQTRVGLRYGGAIGRVDYRLVGQWSAYGDSLTPAGAPARDQWSSAAAGLRADWTGGADAIMVTGQFTAGRTRPRWWHVADLSEGTFAISEGVSDSRELSGVARWTRGMAGGSVLQMQGTHSRSNRAEATLSAIEQSTGADAQVETAVGHRHVLVAGGGYQHVRFDPYAQSLTLFIGREHAHVLNAFVSDEITLSARVKATLGAKVEYDSVTGAGVLPSARIIWSVTEHQRLWASLARARRTPALIDRTLRYYFDSVPTPQGAAIVGFIGNPDYRAETLTQGAVGYRAHFVPDVSVDIVGFYGEYSGLGTIEPVDPVFMTAPAPAHVLAAIHFENLADTTTHGLEVSAEWMPVDAWRLYGSYSLLRLTPHVRPESLDEGARLSDGNAPRAQWQLHSAARLSRALRFDASLYRVGELRVLVIPAYTRADARVEAQVARRLSASIGVQNLLDASHAEFSGVTIAPSIMPRSWHAQLRWSF